MYIVIIFVIGYLAIALEHPIKINKTATALITGATCWALFALEKVNTLHLLPIPLKTRSVLVAVKSIKALLNQNYHIT